MIVPASPQRFDGVRDFAQHLAAALASAQQVVTMTTADDRQPAPGARVLADWSALAKIETVPAAVYVHYQPQAWLRRDTVALLRSLRRLYARGARILLIVHEYQIDPAFTVKRLLARRVFRALARAFAKRAHVLVTTHGYVDALVRGDGLDRICAMAMIPIGSNVPAPREAAAAAREFKQVVMFGQPSGMHPSMTAAAVRAVAAAGWSLVWCCRSSAETSAWLAEQGVAPGAVRIAEGLDAAALSAELSHAAMALAPINDGVSTRRSSIAAFLQHGLPVVGTLGRTTDALLSGSAAFELAAVGDTAAMTGAVQRVIHDAARRAEMSSAASALFATDLAWPRIAAGYLELAS